MEKYLVGGAIRDKFLGLNSKDKDYVVVGATPEEMLKDGYQQVGADFPVFIHPETGDEYALARTERKTGEGYTGFECVFDPSVTIEEDLFRRDLTINAMAMNVYGHTLIDPYNGKTDISNYVLRHVSDAFTDDPVRVLRIARFRARLGDHWKVAPETVTLIHKMSSNGVLDELTPERIWKEMSRALMERNPRLFFDTLLELDVLHVLFPEVYRLLTATEMLKWHPEGNAYEHTMLVLQRSAGWNFGLDTRFACLVHDFGKGITPRDKLPRHFGHDVNGVPLVEKFANRLTVPSRTRDRAMKATRYHMNMHRLDKLNPKTYVKMFDDMNVSQSQENLFVLYELGICDAQGRLGYSSADVSGLKKLLAAADGYSNVKFVDVFPDGETNVNKIKDGMFRHKISKVSETLRNYK